ncbi:hypothetical protein [Methanospirillum lacunae]|uniref:Uncharacterized protein n=1 Tax=Methanospirillum lacunae TaxID=668570 RepID=A0A2V2NEV3_9EURY|nr:hypothetical protein [Methanospirillum lacunae]PWR74121.1 hypothetical protein DK846_02905 [Methanospirillum lacunae]
MKSVTVEVVGYRDSECSPFPCDEERSCGLSACKPSNGLIPATEALRAKLKEDFPDFDITVQITLLDDNVPDYIREIYEAEHPAIPMILINKRLFPIGRISLPQIGDAIRESISSM